MNTNISTIVAKVCEQLSHDKFIIDAGIKFDFNLGKNNTAYIVAKDGKGASALYHALTAGVCGNVDNTTNSIMYHIRKWVETGKPTDVNITEDMIRIMVNYIFGQSAKGKLLKSGTKHKVERLIRKTVIMQPQNLQFIMQGLQLWLEINIKSVKYDNKRFFTHYFQYKWWSNRDRKEIESQISVWDLAKTLGYEDAKVVPNTISERGRTARAVKIIATDNKVDKYSLIYMVMLVLNFSHPSHIDDIKKIKTKAKLTDLKSLTAESFSSIG